ncbi:Bax inhibitor-1/YccA family protein [Chitinibacter bivalviorum]|uniref:Bax inhibitor-1/YccA family protein n=1 Tax=Chitinibacter bivalviorum TaxID=2739434 RepID=A0A7H9BLF4_9NEIS|nr:Bax inhibitor-1/YccA family protein [Chitinibacter bivalviorum]QLG88244.1 Bax inhibitor-1/YccA family protein [Chitinibacter bivalviorum]
MQYNPASYGSTTLAVERNRVLRNTYFLLALSMLPTAAGAILGISMKFAMSPMMGFIVFMAVSFGAFYAIEKTKESGAGVAILLAWTGFMGLWLSQILQVALKFSNGAELIGIAAVGTAAIFFTLATIATVTKKDFSFMGKFLMIGLVIVLLAAIANIFFAIPALSLTISAVAVLLFSGFILFDVSRIVNGGETNYISATLSLYLNIYNLFTSLLNLLMAFSGNSRD